MWGLVRTVRRRTLPNPQQIGPTVSKTAAEGSSLSRELRSFHVWLVAGRFLSMPRKLRIQYPGAVYHVMNRGDRREDICKDDEDRERFLTTLGEACGKTQWRVHA